MEGSTKGITHLQPMVSCFFPFLPRSPARVHNLLSSESSNLPSLFMLPTAALLPTRLSMQAGASLNDGMFPWCHINGQTSMTSTNTEFHLSSAWKRCVQQTRISRDILHLDRATKQALELIFGEHPPSLDMSSLQISSLALYHLVSLCGLIPKDSLWGMSLVRVLLCLHWFYGSG